MSSPSSTDRDDVGPALARLGRAWFERVDWDRVRRETRDRAIQLARQQNAREREMRAAGTWPTPDNYGDLESFDNYSGRDSYAR